MGKIPQSSTSPSPVVLAFMPAALPDRRHLRIQARFRRRSSTRSRRTLRQCQRWRRCALRRSAGPPPQHQHQHQQHQHRLRRACRWRRVCKPWWLWRWFVCVCACVCVRARVLKIACMSACMLTYLNTNMHAFKLNASMLTNSSTCMHGHIHAYFNTYDYSFIHTHSLTHTYTHRSIHACKQACLHTSMPTHIGDGRGYVACRGEAAQHQEAQRRTYR